MIATRLTPLLAVFFMQAAVERAMLPLLDFVGPKAAERSQTVNDGVMGGVSDGLIKAASTTPDTANAPQTPCARTTQSEEALRRLPNSHQSPPLAGWGPTIGQHFAHCPTNDA